ncbi:MAG TPA: GGDEF-domain containing protein, partial [Mycobacterium sp.]|nr:GGDEF-domain containing protein [Mycobacterium sp.]
MKRGTGNPWRRLAVPARVGWLVVAVYSVAAVLIAASSVFGWKGAYATRPVNELVMVLCLVFAAACAGRAARAAVGRRRLGWLALVTALLGWAVGEVIWAFYEARPELEHAMHPAVAEIVLVLYPVGAMASLVLLANRIRNSLRQVLDGLIMTTSLFVVSWVFVLDKQLREDTGSRPATLAHVFADVILMTTAVLTLSRSRPFGRPGLGLLAGGITT